LKGSGARLMRPQPVRRHRHAGDTVEPDPASVEGFHRVADKRDVTSSNRFNHGAYQHIIEALAAPPQLTPREREVLTLVGEGLRNDEIALRLAVSRKRVAELIRWLKLRLRVDTRVEVALAALDQGLVTARAVAQQTQALRQRESVIASLGWPRPLSPRQLDLLVLVAAGLNNREIGERLGISAKSVGVRIRELKMELNARTRVELVVNAKERGVLAAALDGAQ
jgi:DNA-binding NarL/FixJ family response regulator